MSENREHSSSEDDCYEDGDSCGYGEISSQFKNYRIQSEEAVSTKPSYVLHLTTNCSGDKVAAGTSDSTVHIFNLAETKLRAVFSTPAKNEAYANFGVKFANQDKNLIFVGSAKGKISMFDLRKNEEICSFFDEVHDKIIPISCFDLNSNDRILCAGSERILNDAFIVFFDMRQRKALGLYSECHEDDVTNLKFHPSQPDTLISGSTDGLVNIFDISQKSEDDALSFVLNSESSVQTLQWHDKGKEQFYISCITGTEDLKIYDAEGCLVTEHMRPKISESIRRTSPEHCHLVNCHTEENGNIVVLASSSYTCKTLRSTLIDSENRLVPFANYEGNKQIVRDSVYDAKNHILITAGEGSFVTLWEEEPSQFKSEPLKMKSIPKQYSKKPY